MRLYHESAKMAGVVVEQPDGDMARWEVYSRVNSQYTYQQHHAERRAIRLQGMVLLVSVLTVDP